MLSFGSMGILSLEILLFIINVLFLFIYLKASHHYQWFDKPDELRKLHFHAKPTSAGLIFMLPMLLMFVSFPVFVNINNQIVAMEIFILMVLGGIDDFIAISVKIRLIVISLVCLLLLYLLFSYEQNINYYLMCLYFFGIIWWLNLFNFMDGADGMTALHAMVTTIGYLFAYIIYQQTHLAPILSISLFLLCLLSFLIYNFPVAKMFMGDSGSLSVAFLLAVFALFGLSQNIFDQTLVLSFHLVFIVDTTLTLLTRMKFKHNLSQAHNMHVFQALIRSGLSHARVSIIYALVTLVLVGLALYFQFQQINLSIRILVLIIEVIILSFFWINFHNKTKFIQFVK